MEAAASCCVCGTREDSLDNLTSAQLLINQCGHKFCKTCTDRKFSLKSSFTCPSCGSTVRRNTVSDKTLDEIEANEDLKVRKRINEIYNKVEEDFDSLRAYNDYQEMKEDVIYDLVHNINRPAVEARIKKYQQQNENEIRKRLVESTEQDRQLSARLMQKQRESEEELRQTKARDAEMKKVEKETRRQERQIRMGERTTLSEGLLAAQRRQAEVLGFGVANDNSGQNSNNKRSISKFMSASALGLSDVSEHVPAPAEQKQDVVTAVPKIVEQFLQQRPLPKFIPTSVPKQVPTGETAAAEYFALRREACGFNKLTIFKRNYTETLSQLQLCANSSGGSAAKSRVNWPWPFRNK